MKHCAKCGEPGSGELFCNACGHTLVQEEPQAAPAVPATPEATAPPKPRAASSRLFMLLVAVVVSGVGSLMLLASATRTPGAETGMSGNTTSSSTPPATPRPVENRVVPAVVAPADDALPSPRWLKTVSTRRSPLGAGVITFELASQAEIAVWRKQVRPVLTVRCGATTEVFVVTQSAASAEGNGRLHTVALTFDGGAEQVQEWEHSVGHDALFAQDGRALVRQIAAARRVGFTFTPFNAPAATVEFDTAGFDEQLKAGGGKCR